LPQTDRDTITANSIFIGLMSGTSLDGVDIVAVRFDDKNQPAILAAKTFVYEQQMKSRLHQISNDSSATINDLCELNVELGRLYASIINEFIESNQLEKSATCAIGCHGQTIRHQPNLRFPYSLQIGDADIICTETGITTITNFRGRDIALGGQGAPLAPAFHQAVFRHAKINRIIINIGGIANITLLAADPNQEVLGFDTGPGNTLMDSWMRASRQQNFDANGAFAERGNINSLLVEKLLQDPYFDLAIPKSTGTDYFSPTWLEKFDLNLNDATDVQASLTEFSARSIANAIEQLSVDIDECYVCGGGSHNNFLLQRLSNHLGSGCSLQSTSKLGIDPDLVEAVAFAWLSRQCLLSLPGNLPSVTNAKRPSILGSIHIF